MTTAFYTDERCFWHHGGNYALTLPVGGPIGALVQPGGGLPENPETKRRLKNLVEVTGLIHHLSPRSADPASRTDLLRIHPASYLDRFKALSDADGGEIGLRTPFGRGGYEVAALSAGLALRGLTDILTGLYATVGVLAALNQREQSGIGQHIDVALLDVQVACLANQAMNYLTTGHAPKRLGNAHPNIVPYQDFPTADGDFILTVGNDGQFRKFAEVAGQPQWADDPRFTTNKLRVANRAVLIPLIRQATVFKTTAQWVSELEQAGVPCGPINDLAEVFDDPQVQARGMKIAPGGLPGIRSPMTFSDADLALDRPAPKLGEHQDEVLG